MACNVRFKLRCFHRVFRLSYHHNSYFGVHTKKVHKQDWCMLAAPLSPSEEWSCLHFQGFTPAGETKRGWDLSWRDDLPWTWKHLHLLHVTAPLTGQARVYQKLIICCLTTSCFESAANWLLGNTRSVLTVTLKHPPTNKKGKHEMSIQLYILTGDLCTC